MKLGTIRYISIHSQLPTHHCSVIKLGDEELAPFFRFREFARGSTSFSVSIASFVPNISSTIFLTTIAGLMISTI